MSKTTRQMDEALAKIRTAGGSYDATQIKAPVLIALVNRGLVTVEQTYAKGAIKSVDFPVSQIARLA